MGFFGFDLFQVLFTLVFVGILASFVIMLIKNITQWSRNNASPVLTVPAQICAKRQQVGRHHHGNNHGMTSYTNYYVTFQVDSGDRMELLVKGGEYGLLAEGDTGMLTFQGTRFLAFDRQI